MQWFLKWYGLCYNKTFKQMVYSLTLTFKLLINYNKEQLVYIGRGLVLDLLHIEHVNYMRWAQKQCQLSCDSLSIWYHGNCNDIEIMIHVLNKHINVYVCLLSIVHKFIILLVTTRYFILNVVNSRCAYVLRRNYYAYYTG